MGFDEILDKGRSAVSEGVKKVDDARHSERAGKVRTGMIGGFEKMMHAILPGENKAPKEIGSAQQAVDEAVDAANKTAEEAAE